ncbi:MAG: penicillin-binding transpeptidase domain-containing protein [Bacillota bacterium]|nr:penicillin-binding transpeptidase domain-containing protein [Bacillota bacterium]
MGDFAVSRTTVRRRLITVFALTVLITFLLIGRLAWIQIVRADELYEQAWKQWNHSIPVQTARGSIYDHQERLLVGNTSAQTVAAIPSQLGDPENVADALSPILGMTPENILELISVDLSAVYIKRKVDPEVSEIIREMNIPGIVFFNEDKRYYPNDTLASQLLGFVGMDQGWAGLEVYYEDYLSGKNGRMLYPADARGRQMPHEFDRFVMPQQGLDLYLTIDETIQHIVERELDRVMQETAPVQAMAIAVDPYTGAVLAAASSPDFEPEEYDSYDSKLWALSPITSSFEPGSTFKMVTLAAVVEEGLFNPDEHFFCSGHVTISGQQINCWTADRGGHGDLTFYQSVGVSCNPAFIELGRRLGKEKFYEYISAFGYGKLTGIDYPGESSGLVFDPDNFGPLELATSSFGQGISVTPIQQVMATAAMINGGYLYKPYLVESIKNAEGDIILHREPEMIRQVISEETSDLLVDMMESVIIDGTGKAAAIEGYRIAGKTGTAEKLGTNNMYMTDQYIYSLVGFAPVDDPRILLYVAVDGVTIGPRLGVYTSAPLFKKIMEDVLNYLQVTPSELTPLSPVLDNSSNDSDR